MGQPADREVEALHERMLKKQLWVIITKRAAPPEEMKKHLKAHLEHQISLEKQGIMYVRVRPRRPARTSRHSD
jgi:hypothetical protein